MSVWLEGYTEARVNDQWRCIDFFQQDIKGQLKIIPCVIGQSMVRQALEWDCDCNYVMGVPEGLSDAVRKECTDSNGVLAGTESPRWGSWYVIDGKWFDKMDFSIPEYPINAALPKTMRANGYQRFGQVQDDYLQDMDIYVKSATYTIKEQLPFPWE